MNLSSLPPELKLYMIEFLDLVPTLHFALTSKVHLELSRGRLKEHAMFAKYSTIQTTFDGALMWDLTKEILADPRKGWYVRELNLIAGRREMHEALSEEDKALFKAAAKRILPKLPRDLSFFAAEDSSNLRQLGDMLDHSIARGFEDAVCVILIYHLPQLRILRMSDSIGDDCFLVFMRLVAAGYQNPTSAPHMPLQHLKTVQVSHSDTEFCIPVDWAVYFLCIPSLRNFAAFMMGSEGVEEFHADVSSQDDGGGEAHLHNTAGRPVSNVEELMFYNCQFHPQTFNTVLPMVKNLKRFCYHAGGHTVAYADYEPRKVIRTLANHTADSLEELQLTDFGTGEENERDINFVSARGFKKLKALHCEARWLLPEPNYDLGDDEALSQGFHTAEEEPEEIKDPRDNLPDTLEYLYLDGIYNDMEEWYQMTGIFDTPNANTPKLTLDTTCLMSGGETSYGRAVPPEVKFGNHQLEEIRDYLQVHG